jgi:hypothetical protein
MCAGEWKAEVSGDEPGTIKWSKSRISATSLRDGKSRVGVGDDDGETVLILERSISFV